MSYSNIRPALRATRRTRATSNEIPEQRKRKTRSSTATEEAKAPKKRNQVCHTTDQEMTLESSEVFKASSIICNDTKKCTSHLKTSQSNLNTDCPSLDSSIIHTDYSWTELNHTRRRSSRQQACKTFGQAELKQIAASQKHDVALPLHRPHTPTELICGMTSFTFSNYFTPVSNDCSPLPQLAWADCDEVWEIMLQKDRDYKRDSLYIRKHPSLQPRMRAVLLDWLIEVSEVYRLHRETFHLAADFVDRYLSTQRNVAKTRLQLVGVTALFVAAKMEEIYPPKLAEFAYVTDGACTDEEIQQQEMLILQALNWHLSPVTPIGWLTVYLQIANTKLSEVKEDSADRQFVLPRFSVVHLSRVAELIDLCCLDMGYLQFSYSIIAASCLYHIWGKDVTEVTGHKFDELFPCIQWLSPFAKVIQAQPIKAIKSFDKVSPEDAHNIQVHNNGIQLLDFVHAHLNSLRPVANIQRTSPLVGCKGILTPPHSAEKDILI